MTHLIKPSTNVFIIKDSKVLLGRRINTGWKDGWLCAPGGHVEKGEAPSVAILREIKEELGVDVKPDDLEFLCAYARNDDPYEYFACEFIIKDKEYDFQNAEPEKCSELVWVDIHNLPDDIIDDFRRVIEESILGDKQYLELGY